MADDLEGRVLGAAQALREQEIAVQRCVELGRRIDELLPHLAALRNEYDAERRDVERLEGLSLARVLASLRGTRADRLAQEQAQADAVTLRQQNLEARLGALHHERDAAQARVDALAGANSTFAAVLDEKEQYLRTSGDPRARQMLEIADERGRLAGELNEIREALSAAASAQQALAMVQELLGSASTWSTYDTFFGVGAISSSIKHSRLNEAAEAAAHADRCLAVLRTELADVGGIGVSAADLAFDGLTRFLDVWFDNIFTDLAVRDRIRQAQANVADSLGSVQHVQGRLTAQASEATARLKAIVEERESLLTRDSL